MTHFENDSQQVEMYSIQSWCVHSDIINMFHAFVEFYEKFKIHQDITNIVLCKIFLLSIFSRKATLELQMSVHLRPSASQNQAYKPNSSLSQPIS